MSYDDWRADDTTWDDRQPDVSNHDGEGDVSTNSPDFVFDLLTGGMSIALVCPMNQAAREHLAAHVSDEAQWWGDELVVEPRYVDSLAEMLENAGFRVEL